MADTATQAIQFTATIQDETGTKASTPAYAMIDPAQTVTQLLADLAAWATALDAVTDGAIIRAEAKVLGEVGVAPLTGLKTTPVEGARVEQTGVLNFSPAAILRRYGQIIPAIADGVLLGGDKIDLTNAAVITFQQLLRNATGVTVFGYTNPYQQLLANFVDTVTSFRKRRRELARSSAQVASNT